MKNGSLWIIASAFGFATLAIFGKIVMDLGMPKETALAYRFVWATPFLFLWAGVHIGWSKLRFGRGQLNSFLLGFFGIGLEASLFFIAVDRLGASLSNVIFYLYPTITALIQTTVFKKKLGRIEWVAIGLSLMSLIILVDPMRTADFKNLDTLGIWVALGMSFWYAICLIAAGNLVKSLPPLESCSWVSAGAGLFFVCLSLFKGTLVVGTPTQMGWCFALAIGSTVLPFGALYIGIERVGVFRAAFLSTSEMLFTVAMAFLFLGESLSLQQICGAVGVALSVLLLTRNPRES